MNKRYQTNEIFIYKRKILTAASEYGYMWMLLALSGTWLQG